MQADTLAILELVKSPDTDDAKLVLLAKVHPEINIHL